MEEKKLAEIVFEHLMDDPEYGALKELLQRDRTLDLEISDYHANVYYRGCGLMQFKEHDGNLDIYTDPAYESAVGNCWSIGEWVNCVPSLKKAIDEHQINRNRPEEEYKQILVRENNYTCVKHHKKDKQCVANYTDYYIADIEYAFEIPKKKCKIDCLAIRRDAKPDERRSKRCKLAIIEMKYGTNAIGDGKGKKPATVSKHIDDLYRYFCDNVKDDEFNKRIKRMGDDAIKSLEMKNCLGLICTNNKSFEKLKVIDKSYEYILVLANCRPGYVEDLLKEMKKIDGNQLCELKKRGFSFYIAQSNFMGYGLYSDNMITFKDWYEKTKEAVENK